MAAIAGLPPGAPDRRLPTGLALWAALFCYATAAALLMQKVALPLVPSLHLGAGLMQPDAVKYHEYAQRMAEAIASSGWPAWSLAPAPGYTGNVALLAALYSAFRPDPSLLVPVTAALHALSGTLIYLLGRLLAPGPPGRIGGLLGAVAFVAMPTTLSWYGQPLKDAFSCAGLLLVLLAWLWAAQVAPGRRASAMVLLGTALGSCLILFVRPYLATLTAIAGLLLVCVLAAQGLARGIAVRNRILVYLPALCLLLVAGVLGSAASGETLQEGHPRAPATATWQSSPWVPDFLEQRMAAAARFRASFVEVGAQARAGSMIDAERQPQSAGQVLSYLPRALQIGLFAPFPDTWSERPTLTRLMGVAEILFWYASLPGVLLFIRQSPSRRLLLLGTWALFFIAVVGFLNPNVGTLHRMRYPYLMVLTLVGILGWVGWWLSRRKTPQTGSGETRHAAHDSHRPQHQARAGVAAAGVLVATLTLLASIGFFLRDVLMARQLGLGNELDAFVLAMMLPMFLVTVLSVPMGGAAIPVFLNARAGGNERAGGAVISGLAGAGLTGSAALAAALLVAAPAMLAWIAPEFAPGKLARAWELLVWALALLVLSPLVVTGNAALNALGRFALPAIGQGLVPVATIAALLLFADRHGATAVVGGMVAGQLLNLFLVALALRQIGISLRPAWHPAHLSSGEFLPRYGALIVAALFVNTAGPIGSILAATLAAGSVAALNLGLKVVLFLTGLAGTAISTVIAPYFAGHLAGNRITEASHELDFFAVAAALLAMPVALIAVLAALPAMEFVIAGAAIQSADVAVVARIVEFGATVLPFHVAAAVLLQYAVARRRALAIFAASGLGLALNLGLGVALMKHMGTPGLALAFALASAASAALLLWLLARAGDLSVATAVCISVCWALFLGLCLNLHFRNPPGVTLATVTLATTIGAYWWRPMRAAPQVSSQAVKTR